MSATALARSRGLDPGWTRRHDPVAAARRLRRDVEYRRRIFDAFAHSGRGRRRDLVRHWADAVLGTRDPEDRAELGQALADLRRVARVELRYLQLRDVADADFHRARREQGLRMWLHHRPPGGPRGVLLSGPGPALAAFERALGAGVVAEIPARNLAFLLEFEWASSPTARGTPHRVELERQGWEAAEAAAALQEDPARFVAARIEAGEVVGYRWGVLRKVRWAVTRGREGELLARGAAPGTLSLE